MRPSLKKSEILNKEFASRKEANPLYSNRAFARDLDVSHTLLSLILNDKRAVSPELAEKLIRVGRYISDEEREILKLGLNLKEIKPFEPISIDFFNLISHWSYYALLSLLETSDFTWDASHISRRLGISNEKAQDIMDTSLSLKLVIKNQDGQYIQNTNPIAMENPSPDESTKNFNRELLLKAAQSMDTDSNELRDLSSITFAMDPAHLPHAVERIRTFRRSLCHELESLGKPKEVYTISVQIFPLSKSEVCS